MKKSLLIIEDNIEVGNLIKEYLTDLFDEISIAINVEKALDLVVNKKFSLITLDINLQGRNGSEIIKYFIDNPANENSKVPIIVVSGMLTTQFIENNKHRFAGVLVKPFDMNILQKIAEDALAGKLPAKKPVELKDFAEIPKLKCQIPFEISQLDERVEEVMVQVRKEVKLKKLFSAMKINRDPKCYAAVRIGMLINISTAIALKLEWDIEKTLYKFVYAAYLHDIALGDRNDLAKIATCEELNSVKKTLSLDDYKLVYEHPNIAATTLAEVKEIPFEVLSMIRQHHEVPNETGFPSKISFQKIIPFSVVFIIAHDFTNYIMANPNWNLEEYLGPAKIKFIGPHFSKTLHALELLD